MILDIVKLAVGAGTHIMSNRQKRKMLESDAALVHAEKMAKGEIEYQQVVKQSQDNGWKDEFVLILISLPILVLIWSIFSDDPSIKEKIDIFFVQFGISYDRFLSLDRQSSDDGIIESKRALQLV